MRFMTHEVLATRIASDRYPAASAVFWTGSLARGEGTSTSDIDMVVVHDVLDHAFRENFIVEGRLFEVFVHDLVSLGTFFEKDVARGRPVLMHMVVESVCLRGGAVAEQATRMAREILKRGPNAWSAGEIERSRIVAADLLDDLVGARDVQEIRAIGAQLYFHLFEHRRRSRGKWGTAGKRVVKIAREEEGEFGARFLGAFDDLFARGAIDGVSRLTAELYAPVGGVLREWRSDAPPHRSA